VPQCHCRECQYISAGGAAEHVPLLVPPQGFRYTSGEPRQNFSRSDLESPGDARILWRNCGTHLANADRTGSCRSLSSRSATLDDPSLFWRARKWRSTPSINSPSILFPKACRHLSGCLRANRRPVRIWPRSVIQAPQTGALESCGPTPQTRAGRAQPPPAAFRSAATAKNARDQSCPRSSATGAEQISRRTGSPAEPVSISRARNSHGPAMPPIAGADRIETPADGEARGSPGGKVFADGEIGLASPAADAKKKMTVQAKVCCVGAQGALLETERR